MAAMSNKETVVNDLCRELGITRQTLYRYVSPSGKSAIATEPGRRFQNPGVWRRWQDKPNSYRWAVPEWYCGAKGFLCRTHFKKSSKALGPFPKSRVICK